MPTANQPVLQLSWLERYTDNVEVGSSTLPGTTENDAVIGRCVDSMLNNQPTGKSVNQQFGGLAQLARASALHAEGQRFESVILHRKKRTDERVCPEEEKEILMFEKSVGDWENEK